MFNSLDVAAYIAQMCNRYLVKQSNSKIQMLLHCCDGVSLVRENSKICDEFAKVWPYGPVFPRVYKYIHKNDTIHDYSDVFENTATQSQKDIIDDVIEVFGNSPSSELAKEGTPWFIVKNSKKMAGWNTVIPNNITRTFFEKNFSLKEGE